MISQKTIVNKKIFEKQADPYFTDWSDSSNSNYHPFDKSPKSIMYSSIPIKNDKIVPIQELMLGVDTIDFDDSVFGGFGFTERIKRFINMKDTRMLSDKKSAYVSSDKQFVAYQGRCKVKEIDSSLIGNENK